MHLARDETAIGVVSRFRGAGLELQSGGRTITSVGCSAAGSVGEFGLIQLVGKGAGGGRRTSSRCANATTHDERHMHEYDLDHTGLYVCVYTCMRVSMYARRHVCMQVVVVVVSSLCMFEYVFKYGRDTHFSLRPFCQEPCYKRNRALYRRNRDFYRTL